jgi:type I restriction enzyme, S subunit
MNTNYDISAKWRKRRLRFDAQLNPLKSKLDLPPESEVSFVPMDAVGEYGGLRLHETRQIEDVYQGYTYFADGDVCIAKITPCFENGKGALAEGLTNGIAFGTTELHVIRPLAGLDAKFLFYLTNSDDFRSFGEAEMHGAGGQKRVPEGFIKNWTPVLPPLETQRRIAQFLDEKTVRIDALIEKKRALLDRLAEKRQAMITRAVTKGLNPDAPMKPSGIDWLGDIPAHWEVKRLISFCDFQSGKAHEPFIDQDGAYICVNARFVSTDGVAEKRCTVNLTPAIPGDILMVMSDLPNGRALARSFLVNDQRQYAVNQRVCRIRTQRGLPAYFSYQLNRNPQLLRYNDGKEQTHLSNSTFKLVQLLQPPEDEQWRIVDYLDEVVFILGKTAAQIEASVELLTEYRSALITAAVTGQLEIA